MPAKGSKITVHCTGFVAETGKKFWSTHDTNTPFSFQVGLGKVIKGWDEGMLTMALGERAKLHCSSDYAYGAAGFPAWGIPPSAALIFDVEVVAIE
jgi:peptidylprolyl isomerase